MKILFMCVANSARSQMAEGLAREIFADDVWIESAGSEPKSVNPMAVAVLKEIGIDISRNYSKSYEQLKPAFIVDLDYIVTLCAEEVCPKVFSRSAKKLAWPFPDPAVEGGTEAEKVERFRETRDAIRKQIQLFSDEISKQHRGSL